MKISKRVLLILLMFVLTSSSHFAQDLTFLNPKSDLKTSFTSSSVVFKNQINDGAQVESAPKLATSKRGSISVVDTSKYVDLKKSIGCPNNWVANNPYYSVVTLKSKNATSPSTGVNNPSLVQRFPSNYPVNVKSIGVYLKPLNTDGTNVLVQLYGRKTKGGAVENLGQSFKNVTGTAYTTVYFDFTSDILVNDTMFFVVSPQTYGKDSLSIVLNGVYGNKISGTGSISGTTLTMTSYTNYGFGIGNVISGNGITPGTKIIAQTGAGVFTLDQTQTVSSTTISAQTLKFGNKGADISIVNVPSSGQQQTYNVNVFGLDAQSQPYETDAAMYPVISYTWNSTPTLSNKCLGNSLDVNCIFSNKELLTNPLFNRMAFFINCQGFNQTNGRFYGSVVSSNDKIVSKIDNNSFTLLKKYSNSDKNDTLTFVETLYSYKVSAGKYVSYPSTNKLLVSSLLTAQAFATDADPGQANGTVSAIITGGFIPYKYLWTNVSSGTPVINVGKGTYSATVFDANECSISTPPAIVNEKSAQQNTACEITAFSLINPSVTGTIAGTNITLTVPTGTNVSNLIAQFTASTGAKVTIGTVDQVSGKTENNFTTPLTYTVTAEDGKTTKQFIVTVIFQQSTACDITAFSLKSPAVNGTILGSNITLTVPSGTNVSNLIAEFTLSAGASAKIGTVAQTSGQTTNNFTTALTYTITAEDTKTTKQYIVTVNIEKSAACEITAFSLKSPSVVGVIAGDKITLTVPSGTNVSSLVAEFTLSNGASAKIGTVAQTSGQTTNNFTTPLTYTVTAEDTKTTKQYVVTVKVLPSTSCDILSFNLVSPNAFGIIIGNNISLNVPAGTNITNLIAQFTLSAGAKATVNSIDQISAQTSNDFTNLLTYTVTAEDKIATKQYSVKVIINQVQNLKIWSSDFTNSSDWVIKNNSATESLNWEITNAMPSSTTYGDLYGYWLTPASITSFKSTSGGNFLLMNASTPGTGVRTAIITKATPFNTLGKNNIKVQYNQLYRKWKDSAILEVSTDNQNWKKILHNDLKYKSDASSSNPELVVTDISSIAGNKPQVWIRFRFLGTQAPGDYDYAWFIDDVEISEIPQNELHVYRGLISGQTDLVQSCMTNSNEIKIYVKNNGLTPLNTGTVPISYRINGGNILSENAKWLDYKTLQPKASLAYNDTALCVFNSKLDFSASNKYVIKAFTTLTNDSQVANDTATMMITNKTATLVTNNVSYSENFNSQSMNGFTSLSLTGSSKFKLSSEGNTSVVSATPAVCMAIEEGPGVSDDWTFSPCLDLKKDYLYTFSYYSNLNADIPANTSTGAPAFNFAANIEAKLGSANTVAGMTQSIVASKTLTPDSKYVKTETTFSVSQDGIYYIGFHVNNTDAAKIAAVYIDDISLTAKSKACDITSFNIKIPSVTGTITGNNISLTVPAGTDVSNLIAQFVLSEGATVKVGNNAQTSEQTTNNFTAPLQYVVTAQDGTTTKTYTVTVTIQQSSKSTACEIISFSLTNPSVTGTISGSNITLTVPNGTTVTNLIAQFTLSAGANAKIGTIAQTSGQTTNNFTTPLTYTITAEDGITNKTYIVTVNVATSGLSVAKDFLTFGFSNPLISAKISNDSITATLPSGTDASTLVAYFTVSPKATVSLNNIQQQSGKNINDFTTILKYVVTAEDGTKKTYTVKILVSPKLSTLKEILSFTFTNPSVTGIISGTTINLTVPDGTNLASLVAVFTVSPKATVKIGTVSQTSGVTSNNFTTTLVYTVTAEDGTTKNYTVIVNTQSTSGSSDKELISFGIYQPIIPGVINGTNVTITSSTKSIDVTSLIVSFEVSKGAKLVLSGTTLTSRVSKLNFLNPITVTVIAADGSKKDYTINLILPLSNLKQFTFFKIMNPFAEGKIDTLKKEIRLSVPYGTLVTQLQPVYMVSEAAKLFIGTFPQSSGLNTIDFSKPVVYTIVAEDGSKVNYTVYIEVLPKSTLGFEEQDQNVVSIYPNPSSGLFTLKATNGNVFISIMDAQGRVVLNQEVTSYAGEEMQLDLTQFGQGIYFATIQNNEFTKMLKLEVIE